MIPIIISTIALLLSFYTYFKHDKKIKNQSKLINEFQLLKLKKESESEKKAIIEANVIKGEKGKRTIKVYNKGKAVAKNVVVTFPENQNVVFMDYPKSIDIRAQNSIEIIFYAYNESPDVLQINFEWEDGIKANNKDSQIIQV
jgi:hypothetical protein